ncbi:hypothetical protein [Actinomadura napierensis]|uniref:hypothetical protein n=1 Tax=Actinomadura napierensis TaxID=267854 RepID=UPI0031DF6200
MLEHHIGVNGRPEPMPREQLLTAGAEPADPALLNGLPGRKVSVPQVDADAFPVGGVRFPAAALPLGSPVPPALSPVSTQDINAVYGNFGGWRPYTADELHQRYRSLHQEKTARTAVVSSSSSMASASSRVCWSVSSSTNVLRGRSAWLGGAFGDDT